MTAWKPGQELLTVKQAAAYLTLSPHTIRDLVQQGRIEHVRLSASNLRFTREQLDQFVADRLVAAAARPGRRITPKTRRTGRAEHDTTNT